MTCTECGGWFTTDDDETDVCNSCILASTLDTAPELLGEYMSEKGKAPRPDCNELGGCQISRMAGLPECWACGKKL
jgi:hypothetical protein